MFSRHIFGALYETASVQLIPVSFLETYSVCNQLSNENQMVIQKSYEKQHENLSDPRTMKVVEEKVWLQTSISPTVGGRADLTGWDFMASSHDFIVYNIHGKRNKNDGYLKILFDNSNNLFARHDVSRVFIFAKINLSRNFTMRKTMWVPRLHHLRTTAPYQSIYHKN